jgi:hypothetical protein
MNVRECLWDAFRVVLILLVGHMCGIWRLHVEVSDSDELQAVASQTPGDAVVVNPNATWETNFAEQVSDCEKGPGLENIDITVLDEWSCIEWDHLGAPARYQLWMKDGQAPRLYRIEVQRK